MKCPRCSSELTERILTNEGWETGDQRCLDCKHQASWGDFCAGSPPKVSTHGDSTPLGRTGFLISREPIPAERAFMAAVALYAAAAITTAGPYAVRQKVLSLIDQHWLGHIRQRTLAAARTALSDDHLRETWDRIGANQG